MTNRFDPGPTATRRALLGGVGAAAALVSLPRLAHAEPINPGPAAAAATPGAQAGITYGTYDYPYSPDSLLNSVPINPRLGSYRMPKPNSNYYPSIGGKAYGMAIYKATADDGPMTIYPPLDENGNEKSGIWDPSANTSRPSVTIPHFPTKVIPPSGTDGSVAIHDQVTGIVWSFYKVTNTDGKFRTQQAAWGRQDGTGLPDPDNIQLGSPSGGCTNSAGQIRAAEYYDTNADMYYHALFMSLDRTALKADEPNSGYTGASVWPSIRGDKGGTRPTGEIPIGTRMFLPADFPLDEMPTRELRKVARTLQVYGAYVLDRNTDTPFAISVETELDYEPSDGRWNQAHGDARFKIFYALAPMQSCDGYQTASGKTLSPNPPQGGNLLALRHPWSAPTAKFNTLNRRLEFTEPNVTVRRGTEWQYANWARIRAGEKVRLTNYGSEGANLILRLYTSDWGRKLYDSSALSNGQSSDFVWPSEEGVVSSWTASSGPAANGWVKGDLRRI